MSGIQSIIGRKGVLAVLACLLAGLAGISVVLLVDVFYWRTDVLRELPPDMHQGHIIRTVLIFISVTALLSPVLWNAGSTTKADDGSDIYPLVCMTGSAGLALGFLVMFVCNALLFCSFAVEDSLAEWGSFTLWMAACAVLVATLVGMRRERDTSGFHRCLLLAAAVVFFLIGMEEVSWFQRVLGVGTPELFASNAQGEMNFHNLGPTGRGTDYVENAYYMAAFVFLVMLPFIRSAFPSFLEIGGLGFFAPRAFLAVPGAIACAYTYDMWNIAFLQIQFFASVIVLAAFAWHARRPEVRGIFGFSLVLMIVTQLVFLLNGDRFLREWDVTEYREFFIPLGFFLYALDVRQRCKLGQITNQDYLVTGVESTSA